MKKILNCKFLWITVNYLLVFVILSFISRALGLSFWQPANTFVLNLYVFQQQSEPPDVVLLGSSRVHTGFLPTVMEKEIYRKTGKQVDVFNLAQSGGGIKTNHLVLRDVLKGEKTPRIILLEAMEFNSVFHDNVYFEYFAAQRDILLSVNKSILVEGIRPRVRGFVRDASNLLRLVTENPMCREYRRQLDIVKSHKGAIPMPVVHDKSKMTQEELDVVNRLSNAAGHYVNWVKSDVEPPAVDKYWEKFIYLCEKRNIRLIILTVPTRPGLVDVPDNADHARLFRYFEQADRRRNVRFVVLDEQKLNLTKEDFWDFNHLNSKGAEIVSRYIAEEILVPEIQNMIPGESRAPRTE